MAKKKLLVLDPKIENKQNIMDAAEALNLSPYITKNISEALGVVKLEAIHAAWVDMVPNEELAVELIQEIKDRFPAAPVAIFLPDKEMLLDKVLTKDELVELGVAKIYFRPLDYSQIARSFFESPRADVKGKKTSEEDDEALLIFDYEFSPVPIENFIPGSKVFFDTYIRLKKNHFVKLINNGDFFTEEMLDRYQNQKGIQNFFISNKDRIGYINFCNKLLINLSKKEDKLNFKMATLQSAFDMYLDEVHEKGFKKEHIQIGKTVCENMSNIITDNPELGELMDQLEELEPSAYSHAYLVSFISNIIATQFDWFANMTSQNLALAAMFHDLGKTKLDPDIVKKRPYSMLPIELKEYQKHPIYGAEILGAHKAIPPSVPEIVLQHHECNDGSGFPNKFYASGIMNMAKIVFFADVISHMMILKNISAKESLELVLQDPEYQKKFCPDILSAFDKVNQS